MFERYDDVVTVEQLAEMLKIGRNNAYELIRSSQVFSIRVGRQIRIPKEAVIQYIRAKGDPN